MSCYETGREGFTLDRYLAASGISNAVVDAGSLEVKRRRRRAKTDRLDLGMLMNRLVRWHWKRDAAERVAAGIAGALNGSDPRPLPLESTAQTRW